MMMLLVNRMLNVATRAGARIMTRPTSNGFATFCEFQADDYVYTLVLRRKRAQQRLTIVPLGRPPRLHDAPRTRADGDC